ncbi:hypothetical protein ACFCWY_08850 [Streptomyces sp. NPDC056362]|uniref:hypothetical protein n=1 Tax=unclassified Streptomyces TaxID=2593676 RepID=UPI0035DBA6D3
MRIVLHTNDDDEALNAALLEAARRSGTTVMVGDDTWTPERADQFVRTIHGRGKDLLRAVAEGGGWVDGKEYRERHGENALRGPTASITKTVTKGIKEGWLPKGAVLPLKSTYDGRSSWSKTDGYELPQHLAAIFRAAFERVYPARRGNPEEVIAHLTLLYEEMGRGSRAREHAENFLAGHADNLAAWLADRKAPCSHCYMPAPDHHVQCTNFGRPS